MELTPNHPIPPIPTPASEANQTREPESIAPPVDPPASDLPVEEPEEDEEPEAHDGVQDVVAWIQRAGLEEPVLFALTLFQPLAFIGSQMALFAHPFLRGSRGEHYLLPFTEERGWEELYTILHRR